MKKQFLSSRSQTYGQYCCEDVLRNEQVPEVTEHVKKGAFLKFRGVTTVDRFDSELTIASIAGIKKIANFTTARVDTSPQKRVELHCHTKMSDMDGVTDAKSLVKRAYEWGHPAIALQTMGLYRHFRRQITVSMPGVDVCRRILILRFFMEWKAIW